MILFSFFFIQFAYGSHPSLQRPIIEADAFLKTDGLIWTRGADKSIGVGDDFSKSENRVDELNDVTRRRRN